MYDVIGVFIDGVEKIYYFSPNGIELDIDMNVVVETERGIHFGKTTTNIISMEEKNLFLPLANVIRIANESDEKNYARKKQDEVKALEDCKRLIEKYKLKMKLIDANFTFDRSQLVFHFFAESRVDFRELAKELASIYKTRIELRQVGIRDKAKEVGGIGPCGMALCCSKFLYSFDSVSINMAKNQNLSLNPNKINGACGRLLCCLTYENDQYTEYKNGLPEYGQTAYYENKSGRVINVDVYKRTYKIDLGEAGIVEVKAPDLK